MKLTQIRINRLANSSRRSPIGLRKVFQIANVQNANSIFQLTYSSSYPLLINPLKFQTSNEKFLPNITSINHELNRHKLTAANSKAKTWFHRFMKPISLTANSISTPLQLLVEEFLFEIGGIEKRIGYQQSQSSF